jgi:hypothetical protein
MDAQGKRSKTLRGQVFWALWLSDGHIAPAQGPLQVQPQPEEDKKERLGGLGRPSACFCLFLAEVVGPDGPGRALCGRQATRGPTRPDYAARRNARPGWQSICTRGDRMNFAGPTMYFNK